MAFPTSGCVAYYKLNEAAGATRNDSAGSNNLTDHNTVGSSAGKIANAADFVSASSQYLSHADAAAFQMGTGDFSLSAWVKTTAITSAMVEYGSTNSTGYGIQLSGTGIRVGLSDGSNNRFTTTISAWNDGNWHLVIGTFSRSGNMTCTIDNATENAQNIATINGSVNNGNGFNIGAALGADFLNGSVDEVGIWNRVLTSGEMTTLWNGGAGLTFPVSTQSQRRTLSALGTRIGSRQLQEV